MLRNDAETTIQNNQPTGLHNWAKGIKECLEAYGFHDVWLSGGVADKSTFLSSFKNRMIKRFRGDWYSKISTSDRFSTYKVFKVTHQKEKYLDSITIKKFRDSLIKLRLGICEIGVNKRYHLLTQSIKTVLSVEIIWKTNTTFCSNVLCTAT